MKNQKNKTGLSKTFYIIKNIPEKESDLFFIEYNILVKTVESVNNFNLLYKRYRETVKGGPSTDEQQDLYRAMLVFACAGLDVFVKQLIKRKLPQLIKEDSKVEEEFRKFVERKINSDPKETLQVVSLALIKDSPREFFLEEYINKMTEDSLQSYSKIRAIFEASGLEIKTISDKQREQEIRDAFDARNDIIHEMDINVNQPQSKSRSFRSRNRRTEIKMEKYTTDILELAEEIFSLYKEQYKKYQIFEHEKESRPPSKIQK